MKILILGINGFLGNHLGRHFSKTAQITGIDRSQPTFSDFCEYISMQLPDDDLSAILKKSQPDIIIHAAGSANVGSSVAWPWLDFQNSVPLWASLLEQVRQETPASKLIFLSSAAVYGDPKTLPIKESNSIQPVSPYGYHKQMCEQLSEYYAGFYGLQICNIRIFSAYGPGLRRQVLWDICQKAITQERVELMGSGQEQRDFVEIRDIARAIEILIQKGIFLGGAYNLASGYPTTISGLAMQILKTLSSSKELVFSGQQRSGDPLKWQADISSLQTLGFEPEISLSQGVQDYVNWFLRNSGK